MSGRGLVPTEAGDALLAYARRVITLNDEAANSLGAMATAASIRVGLPKGFVEDVIRAILPPTSGCPCRDTRWSELGARRRHARRDVSTWRLLLSFRLGRARDPPHVSPNVVVWSRKAGKAADGCPIPLILYDHPCLFRQAALQALERIGRRWRLSLTTPSPGFGRRSTPVGVFQSEPRTAFLAAYAR